MKIYLDGACKTSNSVGGWAFVVVKDNEKIHFDFNSEPNTTNNRMEVFACIKALEWAISQKIDFVTIISDSMYLIGTMTKNWSRKKNNDLWEILDKLVGELHIYWIHTKGHSGNKWNELCDALAVEASNHVTIKE